MALGLVASAEAVAFAGVSSPAEDENGRERRLSKFPGG